MGQKPLFLDEEGQGCSEAMTAFSALGYFSSTGSAPLLVFLPTEEEETSTLIPLLSLALMTTRPTLTTLRRNV